jgi:hypothetical protein
MCKQPFILRFWCTAVYRLFSRTVSIRISTAEGKADYSVNLAFWLIKLSLLLEEHQGTIQSGVTNYFTSIYFQLSSDFCIYFITLNNMGECMCVTFVFVFVVVFVAVFVVAIFVT